MKRHLLGIALISACGALNAASWTYRGSLDDGGKPANGAYDLRITLLDENSHASVGSPVTMHGVDVRDGQFAVEVDFGVDLANAPPLSLQTEVQQGSSGFVALGAPTRFDPKAALAGVCWDTEGNAGTNPQINFIGTTDNQPLVLRTRNVQSLRIEPSLELFNGAPITANVVAGSRSNFVSGGIRGGTVAGGGLPTGESDPNYGLEGPNRVRVNYGTVGGGYGNIAGPRDLFIPTLNRQAATVGGGVGNEANGKLSTISGGAENLASGEDSSIGGGRDNIAGRGSFAVGVNNQALGSFSSVLGDSSVAIGSHSTVSGGRENCAGGDGSWAGGSFARVRPGVDPVTGGCSGFSSYPGGLGDKGTFIWADSRPSLFESSGPDQFLIRATNGLGLNTNIPTPSHLTIGKNDGTSNTLALGYLGNATRWRIGGPNAGSGAAFEVQSGGDQVLLRVEDAGTTSRVGISRTAVANALEVEGSASKTTAGSWLANSDARIKTEVQEIDGALEKLMKVRPVTFRYTPEYRAAHPAIADQPYYNVIAQEFAKTFPDAVKASGEYLPGEQKSPESEILQVDIHPALITTMAAVQELALRLGVENVTLQAQSAERDAALAAQSAAFEVRLRALEGQR